MIDIRREDLMTLADAAARLPPRRNGRRPHASTLYRWARHGLRGVHLETLRVGDTTCTSLTALQRFFGALTDATEQPSTPPRPRRRRGSAAVERALDDLGV